MSIQKVIAHPAIVEALEKGHVLEVSERGVAMPGFSKSGTALFTIHDSDPSVMVASTRYDQKDVVETYDDIVRLAWLWYDRYRNTGYPLPEAFKDDFLRLGWIRIKTEEVIEVLR